MREETQWNELVKKIKQYFLPTTQSKDTSISSNMTFVDPRDESKKVAKSSTEAMEISKNLYLKYKDQSSTYMKHRLEELKKAKTVNDPFNWTIRSAQLIVPGVVAAFVAVAGTSDTNWIGLIASLMFIFAIMFSFFLIEHKLLGMTGELIIELNLEIFVVSFLLDQKSEN